MVGYLSKRRGKHRDVFLFPLRGGLTIIYMREKRERWKKPQKQDAHVATTKSELFDMLIPYFLFFYWIQ